MPHELLEEEVVVDVGLLALEEVVPHMLAEVVKVEGHYALAKVEGVELHRVGEVVGAEAKFQVKRVGMMRVAHFSREVVVEKLQV